MVWDYKLTLQKYKARIERMSTYKNAFSLNQHTAHFEKALKRIKHITHDTDNF